MSRRVSLAIALPALFLAGLLPGAARQARAEELTPQEFVRELERARAAVESSYASSREGKDVDAESLQAGTRRLKGVKVKTPRGSVDADPGLDREVGEIAEIDSPSLQQERLQQLAQRLESLEHQARRAAARTPPPREATTQPDATENAPASNGGEARKAFEKVLERPHYRRRGAQDAESSGLVEKVESWYQRFLNWWERQLQPSAPKPWPPWIQAILNALAALFPTSVLGYICWALVAALLVALLLVLRSRRRAIAEIVPEESGFNDVDAQGSSHAAPEENYSEEHWRREARLLADRGEFRGAVRALYTGLLLVFQRGGLIRFDKGKTNWEHLRELKRHDRALASKMEPLTRTFDLVWYGRLPVERGTFDAFLAHADDLAKTATGTSSGEVRP